MFSLWLVLSTVPELAYIYSDVWSTCINHWTQHKTRGLAQLGDDWKCPTCSKSPAKVFTHKKMPAPMPAESCWVE